MFGKGLERSCKTDYLHLPQNIRLSNIYFEVSNKIDVMHYLHLLEKYQSSTFIYARSTNQGFPNLHASTRPKITEECVWNSANFHNTGGFD